MLDQIDCFFDTYMAVYFVDQAVPDSENGVLGIDSILFGDILYILGVGTFILDIALGYSRHAP